MIKILIEKGTLVWYYGEKYLVKWRCVKLNQQAKGKIENSLTVLLVSDLEQSKSYYQNALGCEVTEWWAVRDDFGLGFKLIVVAQV
ncbi:VOC family protein [Paenibacillus sp. URB8-2]|uniref:VOC family protein n=1 Tax=Paenibacillus sp. URB8-2 TaxID=2741301 RepID=UPI0015C1F1A3|nr:VOC family protein [Paenibacillus sp. URB8-2]BCG61615.1 hypothetical protein PUR_50400 [Paenibacillus sp. URB8-2]